MATLTIASKNYGSWSLRGWLLCKMAGLDFEEQIVASDDPSTRAELLLLSSQDTHGISTAEPSAPTPDAPHRDRPIVDEQEEPGRGQALD